MADAERTRLSQAVGTYDFVLTNALVSKKGNIACIDTSTGYVAPVRTATTLIPIGYFLQSITGDGTLKVSVEFFDGIKAQWMANDTGTAVAATDRGATCYLKDGATVSMDTTGRSKAGMVLDVSTADGVLVYMGATISGAAGAPATVMSSVATTTALKAVAAADRANGKLVMVDADGSLWRFAATSTASDTSEQLVLTPDAGTGAWLRADRRLTMSIPITYAKADAAVLHTVPTGFILRIVGQPYWDVTTQFAGGSSSSIGLSSGTLTGYTTKGDLIAATLTAALTAGVRYTAGTNLDTIAHYQACILQATDTIRHDRIVSAFTSGAGNVRVPVEVLTAPASA